MLVGMNPSSFSQLTFQTSTTKPLFRATKFPKQILVDGLYAIYLKHWLTVFKRDKMLVIDGNDLCKSAYFEVLCISKLHFRYESSWNNARSSKVCWLGGSYSARAFCLQWGSWNVLLKSHTWAEHLLQTSRNKGPYNSSSFEWNHIGKVGKTVQTVWRITGWNSRS